MQLATRKTMRFPPRISAAFLSAAAATASHAQIITPNVANGHLLDSRWSQTATNGSGLVQGQATTLTWGFVADGTSILGAGGEPTSNSSLISFLDTNVGSGGGGSDYTNRPWFSNISSPYNRWGQLSGLTFNYVTYDDGVQINGSVNASTRGTLNVRPDIRIGGHSIDGQAGSNTLAYNYFPNAGDMVIDTDNVTFFSNSANSFLSTRNTVAHEVGHGLGIDHLESNTNRFLMEPFIDLNFDGPQHSDILAIQRGYGDVYEKGTGNDSRANATSLGNAATFTGIGLDGDNTTVAASNVDFVSIDGSTDTDFFSITLDQDGEFDVILESLGLTYNIREQDTTSPFDAPYTSVDTSALNNLALALFDVDGVSLLAQSTSGAVGETESILGQLLTAGTYFIRVTGSDDRAQFYSLATNFAAIPEPGSAMLLCASSIGLLIRRRRR